MNLKLVVISEAKCDSTELILSEDSYGVGRRQSNQLRIQEDGISGCHAELKLTAGGDYEVSDLDSTNGTFLNGIRVTSPKKIEAGDFLKFGILKVAVEEHIEGAHSKYGASPAEAPPLKIVSLKDRFSEAKKKKKPVSRSATDKIAVQSSRESTTTQQLDSNTDSSANEEKKIEQAIKGLRKQLAEKGHENSELHLRVKSAEATETTLNERIATLEALIAKQEAEAADLKSGSADTADGKNKLESLESELETLQGTLSKREEELESLREALNQSQVTDFESGSEADKLVLFDAETVMEDRPQRGLRAQLNELTASRDAAEEEARRLREELSRAREEPSGNDSDKAKRLSFHITELESSLSAERLLHEDVRAKNEQFRNRVQFLTEDLDNALEEISRLKASNAQQFILPDNLEGQMAELAKLRQDLVIAHEDNADQRKEIIDLKKQLAEKERTASDKAEDAARQESNTISELHKQIRELNSRIDETESSSEDFEREKAKLAESQQDLERQLEDAEGALKDSTDREAKLSEDHVALVQKLEALENRSTELEAQLKDDSSSASENETRIRELKEQLAETESDLEAQEKLRSELESAEEKQLATEEQIEQLHEKIESLETANGSLEEQLTAADKHRSELDSDLATESELASERSATIDRLREELSEASQTYEGAQEELIAKHQKEVKSLNRRLDSVLKKEEKLKEELEDVRLNLSSAQETSEKEQSHTDKEHRARLAEIEEELAQSLQHCDEIESEREELTQSLEERDNQITELEEHSEKLERKFKAATEEVEQLESELQLTREGLSEALHATQQQLAEATKDNEAEILRRDKVEKQLRKAESALEELLDEVEALRAEPQEEIALTSHDNPHNRISELIDDQTEEQKAFEARLEALYPTKHNGSENNGNFSEVEFYRQLVNKLDLIDELIKCYENKWRFSKLTQQLAQIKEAFLDLLEDHSVNSFMLDPGTPMCLNQSNRIDLAPLEDGTVPKLKPFGKSEVVETLSPGYVFHNGSGDVILRKAKVVVT